MASVGHLFAGLAVHGTAYPDRRLGRTSLALVAAAYLPDADVVAFVFGIPYAHPWGHRGAAHSIVFAVLVGVLAYGWARLRASEAPARWGLAITIACLSHPLLDMLTDGGLGVGLFWPVSDARLFFPWRPLPVAPIGGAFLSKAGLLVAATETLMLLPLKVKKASLSPLKVPLGELLTILIEARTGRKCSTASRSTALKILKI